ncbi:AC34 [Trabala vishnou gigantina nucleopolyhedrovirus]|uniref:AC34 n=1 Tax=Trabala vishnou gigantina nucleopolyhedrovirus TaxID=2863583 RepID=UPI00248201E4|nr:AC34 [Trabala vishnou gigantina nucleopolyhedrovirus]QYC92738.1 AC34 [Trabala vishnou gigantina nucleopolyhedrovirus]
MAEQNSIEFRKDIKMLTDTIIANNAATTTTTTTLTPTPTTTPIIDSKLGDVLEFMGRNGLLLRRKKDENFCINETIHLSDETRIYLNTLQTEKLYHCRMCYHKNSSSQCWFHKKYIFDKNPDSDEDDYTTFLNSEMGIVSYVELYYSYLSVEFWRVAAKFLFRDLTGFDNVKSLLEYYNYECAEDADLPAIILMDCDYEQDADNADNGGNN